MRIRLFACLLILAVFFTVSFSSSLFAQIPPPPLPPWYYDARSPYAYPDTLTLSKHNVTDGDVIDLSIRASDVGDMSGGPPSGISYLAISYGGLGIESAGVKGVDMTESSTPGIYVGQILIGPSDPVGTYRISSISLQDHNTNSFIIYNSYPYDWESAVPNSHQYTNLSTGDFVVSRPDTIASVTTIALTPNSPNGNNGWYKSDVAVALAATDNISGIATTEYRSNGGSWTPYGSPFNVTTEGTTSIEYRSVDNVGNVEIPNLTMIKIDKTAPTTTAALNQVDSNGWYKTNVQVTLNSSDNKSGVNYTEFSLDSGMNWSIYTQPLTFTQEGQTEIEYRSLDNAGNQESTQKLIVKIDKTSPELGISFDPITKKFIIAAVDSLSGPVSTNYSLSVNTTPKSVSESVYDDDTFFTELAKLLTNPNSADKRIVTSMPNHALNKQTVTLKDKADNSLEVVFSAYLTNKQAALYVWNLKYNGVETPVSRNAFTAKWSDNNGTILQLQQAVFVQNQLAYTTTYNSGTKSTKIIGHRFNEPKKIIMDNKPGMIIMQMYSEKGSLNIKY